MTSPPPIYFAVENWIYKWLYKFYANEKDNAIQYRNNVNICKQQMTIKTVVMASKHKGSNASSLKGPVMYQEKRRGKWVMTFAS